MKLKWEFLSWTAYPTGDFKQGYLNFGYKKQPGGGEVRHLNVWHPFHNNPGRRPLPAKRHDRGYLIHAQPIVEFGPLIVALADAVRANTSEWPVLIDALIDHPLSAAPMAEFFRLLEAMEG